MYLDSRDKTECSGCEACVQVCPFDALEMKEDPDGFRYPVTDSERCVNCNKCRQICPIEKKPKAYSEDKYAFGGYISDPDIRFESTSGGAFTAIARSFFDKDSVIFGAEAEGLKVFHSYITDIGELGRFRKSKYSQSIIGDSYKDAKLFLDQGKKVLFSGTPCQIAGLIRYLGDEPRDNLLTVEVVCEGVPSPLYVRKLDSYLEKRYGSKIESLDYRYTGNSVLKNGKWDFEIMKICLADKRTLRKDRWFNPFWNIWLSHLMSRPSCYKCRFANSSRVADITLGDLWGVHLYCPELYGRNGGSSLAVCNTPKGKAAFAAAQSLMKGHELRFEDALRYQSPMRRTISDNPRREEFMADLRSDMDYKTLSGKWADKPGLKLLWQKYIWGNRQKIFVWNLRNGKKVDVNGDA